MDENEELNSILATIRPDDSHGSKLNRRMQEPNAICHSPPVEEAEDKFDTTMVQWSTSNGVIYIPTGHTVDVLKPGYYEISAHPNIGLYFEKIPVKTDGLLEFPDANTKRVTTEIKKFWNSEEKFRERNLTYKRGIILWGPPGGGKCFQKDTPVLMYDGTIKMVQDVELNDMVMGDDSSPRQVLSLSRGSEMLYRVVPTKGNSYVVNESHILSLKRHGRTSKKNNKKTDIIDISVKDWMVQSATFKQKFKGYRAKVAFDKKPTTVDPYFLGLWLGDGNTNRQNITSADEECVNYLSEYAHSLGMKLTQNVKKNNRAKTYAISAGNGIGLGCDRNSLLNEMRQLNVLGNKHIPIQYKTNSAEIRLELLAGLLDSDGSYSKNGTFDFVTKLHILAEDVLYLCRSLGFAAYVKPCQKHSQSNVNGTYYRICISGNLDIIPTKILRKKAKPRKQIKDVLVTGIKVAQEGVGDYYGFEVNGNHRFLLGDFTVTHNSCTLQLVSRDVIERGGIVIKFTSPGYFSAGIRKLREIQPDTPVVVLMEDIDSTIIHWSETEVINILDGVDRMDKIIFLATTNYPEKLGQRIMNRPSRFDKRYKVGYPNADSRRLYLNYLLGDKPLDVVEIDRWVEDTQDFSIAHLKELFVAVVVFEDAYEDALKTLKTMKTEVTSWGEEEKQRMGLRGGNVSDLCID